MSIVRFVTVCAYFYGFLQALPRLIIEMATEDIVAGTFIQSPVLMLLFASSDTITKMCSPLLIRKISFLPTAILVGLVWLVSYLLIVAVDSIALRLLGVLTYGIANGLANVLIVLLLAYFDEIERNASAFQIGASSSYLFAALLYTSSTAWQCVSPRVTIAFSFPLGFSTLIFYGILNHGFLKKYQITEHRLHHKYTQLTSDQKHEKQVKLIKYLQFFLEMLPFASYVFLAYVAYYVAANSVLTTLTFPSAPFRVRDHYQYYRLAGNIGQVLGGMTLMLESWLCPSGWFSKIFCSQKIWVLVLVHVGHLMFFLCASWYHFVQSVYTILLLSASHGFLLCFISVRALSSSAEDFGDLRDRGTAMAFTEIGISLGRLVSGLVGIFVEQYLWHHCVNELFMGKFCLARFSSGAGWNENLNCI